MWNAAVHELLVFGFSICTLLCWLRWLRSGCRDAPALAGFTLNLALALFSKESAVALVPVLAAVAWIERARGARPWGVVAVCTAAAAMYAFAIFQAATVHQRLNDGTFSWRAPFWITLPNSLGRMLWTWGFAALGVLLAARAKAAWPMAGFALFWMVTTLAPYSFLPYMSSVPSRHTYLASAGLSLLSGAAYCVLRDRLLLGGNCWGSSGRSPSAPKRAARRAPLEQGRR